MSDETEAYMCGVDYQHHLDCDRWGTKVYPSIKDLELARKCTKQCGVVKVKVTLVEWVKDQDFKAKIEESDDGT